MITVSTRSFGSVCISEEDIFEFTRPILGFSECKKFALINDSHMGEHIKLLQSLDEPHLSFILIDPEAVDYPFSPAISNDYISAINAHGKEICAFAIAVVPKDFKNSTVNLKSPLVFCKETGLACQIVLDENYPIKHRLFDIEGGNG